MTTKDTILKELKELAEDAGELPPEERPKAIIGMLQMGASLGAQCPPSVQAQFGHDLLSTTMALASRLPSYGQGQAFKEMSRRAEMLAALPPEKIVPATLELLRDMGKLLGMPPWA